MATQEKTWNVANRMHSQKDSNNPEVNHIVAGADEIYDDAKQIKQSEHNAQTDSRLDVVESDINAQSSGIKDRLATLENEVSFEGEIQVENTPQGIVSGSGKVATANAVSGAIHYAINSKIPTTNEEGFHITDENSNIGLQYGKNGLDVAKVSNHFVEVLKAAGVSADEAISSHAGFTVEDGFFITDENLNVGVKVDNGGIHAPNILEYEIVED